MTDRTYPAEAMQQATDEIKRLRALLTAEPTDAEVEAAARALWDLDPEAGYTFETDPSGQFLLRDARAALKAAAEARR